MNYLRDIYRLRYIKRYSNVATIHKESVAEHGFFVAAIVIDLAEEYIFDLGIATIIAVAHDMPEIELNDCPHTVKRGYPEIEKAFEVCEARVAKELPLPAQFAVEMFNAQETVEAKIVMLADIIQVRQYAESEIRLGNSDYMNEVSATSQHREAKLRRDLEINRRKIVGPKKRLRSLWSWSGDQASDSECDEGRS